ncbi:MAG: hypothetical protein J3K34DRAFT_406340 [Monoraphidium minutum]|nr:MAG: hypothetical protein J3K34DRAFT_406340 [Monoraphidium minutum]
MMQLLRCRRRGPGTRARSARPFLSCVAIPMVPCIAKPPPRARHASCGTRAPPSCSAALAAARVRPLSLRAWRRCGRRPHPRPSTHLFLPRRTQRLPNKGDAGRSRNNPIVLPPAAPLGRRCCPAASRGDPFRWNRLIILCRRRLRMRFPFGPFVSACLACAIDAPALRPGRRRRAHVGSRRPLHAAAATHES